MQQHPLWWQRGVIYQIYPRSFQDSNNDGLGDLRGINDRLEYLTDTLPVDAIWLSPFYPSPMADFGYDVSNYTDVDPQFGTLGDFDHLVNEAHARNIRVIVDFVPNHSSDQHPWFQESRSSRTNPKRDWYVWRDAKPDGSLPNNWLAVFGGPAWEYDDTTHQYYLHSFLPQQPDLNWRNPEVKQAMFDALRFWLDRGVDGFRIDVAHLIMKDPELRDNPPNPSLKAPPGSFNSQLHVYDRAHPDVHAVYQEIRRMLDDYSASRPRMMVGEIHEYDWPTWATYYGPRLNEFHLPFNFGLLQAEWTAQAVRAVVDGIEDAVRPLGAWPNYVLGNHDEHRIASRVGEPFAPLAMMLLLTLRGTPTVYYGDELGMHDVDIPPDRQQDPFGLRVPGKNLGRDPERTPMQWDGGPNAGFCPPGVESWLPIADDASQINVEAEHAVPDSMLTLTQRLLSLRASHAALYAGTYRPIDTPNSNLFVFVREAEDERFAVALNFGTVPASLDIDDLRDSDLVLSTRLDRELQTLAGSDLGPAEGRILRLHAGVS